MQNTRRLSPDDTRADAIRKARLIRQWKHGWFRPLPLANCIVGKEID